eukprot:6603504-Prymnesium_polylepis.1
MWASPSVLRAARRGSCAARAALLVSGAALAAMQQSSILLRGAFFASVAVADLSFFTGYGGHPGF